MNSKTFLILLAVCGVLAGATYFTLGRDDAERTARQDIGGKLLADLDLGNIRAVRIQGPKTSADLVQKEDAWAVENRYGFPADFSLINDMVKKMSDMTVGRSFAATEDVLSRLALRSPDAPEIPDDQKGTRVSLKTGEGTSAAELIFGKTRETDTGSGGQYVLNAADNTVYLVDQNFRGLDRTPAEWLKEEIFKVDAGEIEKLVCRKPEDAAPLYVLKRPEKGKNPEFVDLAAPYAEKKTIASKVNSAFNAISSIRISDVADPENPGETGLDQARCFEYHLYDGTVYRVYPGEAAAGKTDEYYFKVGVDYEAPEAPAAEAAPEAAEAGDAEQADAAPDTGDAAEAAADENGADQPEPVAAGAGTAAEGEGADGADAAAAEAAARAEKQRKAREAAAELDARLSPWVFTISKWKRESFVTDMEAFFETPKEEQGADKKDQPGS